jgi:hypothetical protein
MGSLLRWRSQPAINLLHRLTGLPACFLAQMPCGGVGTRCLLQVFFSTTSDIPKSSATSIIGRDQTRSYMARGSVSAQAFRL